MRKYYHFVYIFTLQKLFIQLLVLYISYYIYWKAPTKILVKGPHVHWDRSNLSELVHLSLLSIVWSLEAFDIPIYNVEKLIGLNSLYIE